MASSDFGALASQVGAVEGVRACAFLSADGLTLASHPGAGEPAVKAFERVLRLGPVERGFVVIGAETWVFAQLGGYYGVAVAGPEARPGVVLDALDRALRGALEREAGVAELKRVGEPPRRLRTANRAVPRSSDPARPRAVPAADADPAEPEPNAPLPFAVDPLELSREFKKLLGDDPTELGS